MSSPTTLPAPTIECSPIVTPAVIMHPGKITDPFFMITGAIFRGKIFLTQY